MPPLMPYVQFMMIGHDELIDQWLEVIGDDEHSTCVFELLKRHVYTLQTLSFTSLAGLQSYWHHLLPHGLLGR